MYASPFYSLFSYRKTLKAKMEILIKEKRKPYTKNDITNNPKTNAIMKKKNHHIFFVFGITWKFSWKLQYPTILFQKAHSLCVFSGENEYRTNSFTFSTLDFVNFYFVSFDSIAHLLVYICFT